MTQAPILEPTFTELIAREIGCKAAQVQAADALFGEGATVPFVARYRKEATGGLGDEALEALAKRREYFLELAARRDSVLETIDRQGKLRPDLEAAIRGARSKQELEDLYLPYKPKRRTRAQMARERGLEPLADALLEAARGPGAPASLTGPFVDPDRGVAGAQEALAGARDILAERLAEDASNRARLRRTFRQEGVLTVRVLEGKEEEGEVYRDYFDHREPIGAVASHRLLAILRGEREGFLLTDLAIDEEAQVARLEASWGISLQTPCGEEIREASADGYRRLLRPSVSNEVRAELRERAEAEAINVFRANLEALLLQSPLGQVPVVGLDPGYRTGCKMAVVDGTGRVLATDVLYPIPPRAQEEEAARRLVAAVRQHGVQAVAVGNGTGGRETESFARKALAAVELPKVIVAIVPETGASVYSASAIARDELPDVDVSLRGAASIARRLQDPLAELVKIEPKSLGVGQYQHDVDQKALGHELDLAVESAVHRVGVELNTASSPLLRRVSGLSERLAKAVVRYRDDNGPFDSRRKLLKVAGFGPKAFELSAGFLRLRDGAHPLDRTAVHPERYGVVEAMAKHLGSPLEALVGNSDQVARIDFRAFVDDGAGLGRFTLEDIRRELEKPGRDPRPDFRAPQWRAEVTTVGDLSAGMVLEGRVSNVTNFGAFVDIGVKRDGLVHLSELSERWVDDPRQVVQVGQIVKVRVLEVDRQRQRISLSMKSPAAPGRRPPEARGAPRGGKAAAAPSKPATIADLQRRFQRR